MTERKDTFKILKHFREGFSSSVTTFYFRNRTDTHNVFILFKIYRKFLGERHERQENLRK